MVGVLGEAAQLHVEDVVGLHLVEVEGLHQPGARLGGVLGAPDDGDDVVDVGDGDHEAAYQVQAVLGLAELEPRPAKGDLEAVVEVDLEHLLQRHGAWLALDERDGVDREGVFKLGLLEQLLQQRVGIDAVLDLDHQTRAVGQVGEVLHVGNAGELLVVDALLDLLDDPLRPDHVGQFGHHDAHAPGRHLFDPGGRAQPERAAAGGVGVADAVEADDRAAGGKSGPGMWRIRSSRSIDGLRRSCWSACDDFDEVVRGDVGGHAHGDAGGSVDQQVRAGRTFGSWFLPS